MESARLPLPLVWLVTVAAVCSSLVQGYPCGSPGKPLHGSVSPRGQLFYAGENVTITCRPGYVRFGQPTRTCSQDGTWQGLMPFCRRNVAFRSVTQGATVPLSPQGPPSLPESPSSLAVDGSMETCSRAPRTAPSRWWQVRLPSRTRVESVGLVVPQAVHLDLMIFVISLDTPDSPKAEYLRCANFSGGLPDSKRLFRCGAQGLVGEYVYIRDERQHLDYFTLCEVEVFAFRDLQICGDPETPAHGHVTRPDADTATYGCEAGYRLAGHRQRRCIRGEWAGQQPVCRKIFCERPPPLENGFLEQAAGSQPLHQFNDTAQYRCHAGFVMQGGPGLRTCAITGRWSGAMPRCQPLVCPMPERYENARYELLNGTTRWQAMVQYECLEGFVLGSDSDEPVTQCEDDGRWRPVNVTCTPRPPPPVLGPGLVAADADLQSGAGRSADISDSGPATEQHGLPVTHEHHQAMSSGVMAAILVVAAVAIVAMIVVGILFTRKRSGACSVWRREKRPEPTVAVLPPTDIKTYDQVYEPNYQNVLGGAPTTTLSTFRAPPTSQRSSGEAERPLGRPVEPPYETLKARLAAEAAAAAEDDPYEPVAGGRLYDAVSAEGGGDSGPYASLASRDPDYETLRALRGEEGDYDLVPAGAADSGCPEYDQVPVNTYENCRFVAGTGAHEVPDLLKGAPPSRDHDIPPEILALYAKVIKSKKRNRDETTEPPVPTPAPDSACPSSPGSSAASSYTKNLIQKFNRLAGADELESPTRPAAAEDRVQCSLPGVADTGVHRLSVEAAGFTAVRPLPPVPPER
ncbi:uncharacterized protein LOC122389224 [Amphibalanus amphitrite]|uniref:uncharacterized protein LOC122389224 n=1 Tax=Amphibalanus amphitrite TaxID=1232801 RepID=UPI001C8FE18A|nr:uncharacterized protein LOC122389224 [Amphibalanus amphitrite]